jgi:type III restriction enzyme
MTEEILNPKALEPLYHSWEEPNKHRLRGGEIKTSRRPSPLTIAQHVRAAVREWRDSSYPGASETTRELFGHWFFQDHLVKLKNGSSIPFRYHFCQREAIETFVYLKEVIRCERVTKLMADFGGYEAETLALGVDPETDLWAKYAFKMATGSGKTKVMSLAIVWSYFHALRESDSPMARHFVIIAPNITVFERLKEDFDPPAGGPGIFEADPLIPSAWSSDWNLSTVLQDKTGGASAGGTLYLTNIHRLYDTSKRRKKEAETYVWAGPSVSKAKALDTSSELRKRITSHDRVMVLNDEAHHVWDPGSAWNEAIEFIDRSIRERSHSEGVCAQLDFSATPRDNKGQYFQYVICDSPLGEAVDAGIVKTPVIGRCSQLKERLSDNASERYQQHLLLAYERWRASKQEWAESGKKPIMFVMTEDTDAADDIAQELNKSELYKELNGRVINLHTNLKGKLKKVGKGKSAGYEFVESEKDISDDDLQELRKLSRELDEDPQHACVVSVLMLREGWDIRNVTTIVPLRPLNSKSQILPEQTLGRGLRRMTAPGQASEIVTVVEHKAFASLYQQELSQQGVEIEVVEVDKIPRTTVAIFPDEKKFNFSEMEIALPTLSEEYRIVPELETLSMDDVRKRFSGAGFEPIRLGEKGSAELDYEGRTLLTDEMIQQMKIQIPLLKSGFGAVSYYREQIERMCKVRGLHAVLAPLIQTFFEDVLFGTHIELSDQRLVNRLPDADVAEHIRATFVPLIQQRITRQEKRQPAGKPTQLSHWKPYQVTHSESRPTVSAPKTLFNLVPCNQGLEVAFSKFVGASPDVIAFAKNAGPQSLRIDYLSGGTRLAFYTPDFFVHGTDNTYYVVETKGRADPDVSAKARAAVGWCKAGSSKSVKWSYVYVPQGTFERLSSLNFADLVSLCRPALADLLVEASRSQPSLPFEQPAVDGATEEFVPQLVFARMPPRYQSNIEQAVMLFRFLENKQNISFSPVFTPLLGAMEDACNALILARLLPAMPSGRVAEKDFFNPILSSVETKKLKYYQDEIKKLERALVFRSPISPMGHLKFCLEYGAQETDDIGGVLHAIKAQFGLERDKELLEVLRSSYQFRNKYIAHQEHASVSKDVAQVQLHDWIRLLFMLYYSRQANRVVTRYRELVDKMHLEGLSDPEAKELEDLGGEIDAENEYFYGPIIKHLKRAISAESLD